MSRSLIDRSHDLQRLRDEGYQIETTHGGHLLLREVPYVTAEITVERGILVSKLELEMGPYGAMTKKPREHVAHFIGETPCDQDGNPLESLIIGRNPREIEGGIVINFDFSRKIQNGEGYEDYYHKMKTYVGFLCRHARAIDQSVTAFTRSD